MNRRSFIGGITAATAATTLATGAGASRRSWSTTSLLREGALHALLVTPARPNNAGVLLLPTIAAIDPYMRSVAAELARLGYHVAVWNPYGSEIAPVGTMPQLARSKRLRDDDAMRELRLAVDHLTGPMKLRSVSTIGWCLGGRFALLQGGHDARLAAVIAYNPTIYSPTPVALNGIPTSKDGFPGQTQDEFALAARIACPVQILRPEHDLAQPSEYARLAQVLQRRRAATQIHYFPDAAHGFSYKQDVPANRAAARLAWPATLALLESVRPQSGA